METNKPIYKILVVEDMAPIREAISDGLESRGYRVWVESSGYEALDDLQNRIPDRPDLIITDCKMAPINGLELVDRLRADPKTRDVKIIGYGDFPHDAEGFDFILQKRLNLDELYAKVQKILGG